MVLKEPLEHAHSLKLHEQISNKNMEYTRSLVWEYFLLDQVLSPTSMFPLQLPVSASKPNMEPNGASLLAYMGKKMSEWRPEFSALPNE